MAIVYGANYGRPSLDLNFAKNKSLIDTVSGQNLVTFTRSSTGTYVDSDGLIKTASANEPRFDHDPVTGVCNGLLIEESRTNGILYNDLSAWITEPTKTFETGLSGIFSQSYSFTTTYSGGESGRIYSTSGLGNVSTNQIVSVFVKQKTNLGGNPSICFRNSTSGSNAYFNLDTLSFGVTSSTEWSSPGYQNFGNGWYRFYAIFVGSNTNAMRLYMGGTNGSVSNATVGTGFYLNGFQAETGSFPTSYIPTSGSTSTRSGDAASITGTNFSSWYNQSEGTMYVEDMGKGGGGTGGKSFVVNGASAGSFSRLGVYDSTSSNFDSFVIPTNQDVNIFGSNTNTFMKHAAGLQNNNTSYYKDGILVGTDTSCQISGRNIDNARIGDNIAASAKTNGVIRRLAYYPTRLQNFQLQQLTK